MKRHISTISLLAAGLLVLQSAPAAAATLFSDDFDVDSSANYNVLLSAPADNLAGFAFDYSDVGIPEAPSSTGSTTTGVRLSTNSASTSAIQLAPIGLAPSLVGVDYTLTYDLWMNANGPLPAGGGGSTEAMMVGVGFDDSAAIAVGATNGTYFTVTGEGGSSTDIRTFTNDGFNAAGINQGPSNNSNDAYYAGIFPGGVDVGALPTQGGMGNQTGTTVQGQMAFSWHKIKVDVRGSKVDFYIDDLIIASDADADITGNVFVGYGDYFSGASDAPMWSFGLIDNLVVSAVPEPTSAAAAAMMLLGLAGVRRRK